MSFERHTDHFLDQVEQHRIDALAKLHRQSDTAFADWAEGYGVIQHSALTQLRVRAMVDELVAAGKIDDAHSAYARLSAADRIASAAMRLVVHMSYAKRVPVDGSALTAADFKEQPEGHTGGSLNMVPAYAGYLLLNALDGSTRAWLMGQGHCVAAIDALNLIVDNMSPAHVERYGLDEDQLARFVTDFYAYSINPDGSPASPLGSHVNAHTGGGSMEGGYLGFAELQYVHAPLPGEQLVAFLSDGAFEEQRGSDWAPRWWRAADSGLVAPIMVLNGRRIEQRSQIEQQGGEDWLDQHLRNNGFEPIRLDGRDPASIAWGVHTIEARMRACIAAEQEAPEAAHQIPLRYGIAETIKGYGFPGAGGNAAHNLPLPGNPAHDQNARALFNSGSAALFVAEDVLAKSIDTLNTHKVQGRVRERDHWLARRHVPIPSLPEPGWFEAKSLQSPMAALDQQFVAILGANPGLRARVGNPDELRSNKLDQTLDLLKHRVHVPETGIAESRHGGVITALNEEAVVCAALGNKGGINLVVTYEAFATKMLGALRQEIIFARQQALAGHAPGWLSVPIVLTSHTWENAKNEQSHQDPTLSEALMAEMSDGAPVRFPADAHSAMTMLSASYGRHAQIVTLVVPKRPVPVRLTPVQALLLADHGALLLDGDPASAQLLMGATGAYQLGVVERARARLDSHGVSSALIYLGEPGRLRQPRDPREASYVMDDTELHSLFPPDRPRLLVTHTRPEPYLGMLRRIDSGPATTRALGYINRGGTLDVEGLLFANRCSWAHAVDAAAELLGLETSAFLSDAEHAAVEGRGDPNVLR
jgi:phosphoketolase